MAANTSSNSRITNNLPPTIIADVNGNRTYLPFGRPITSKDLPDRTDWLAFTNTLPPNPANVWESSDGMGADFPIHAGYLPWRLAVSLHEAQPGDHFVFRTRSFIKGATGITVPRLNHLMKVAIAQPRPGWPPQLMINEVPTGADRILFIEPTYGPWAIELTYAQTSGTQRVLAVAMLPPTQH